MKYMNIRQAAEKWDITVRRVQELCKSGAIDGAERFGRAWMIPEDTQKPADRRTKAVKLAVQADDGLPHLPMPKRTPLLIHTNIYNTPGTADEVIAEYANNPEIAKIISAQFDYQHGNIDKIYEQVQYFLTAHSGYNAVISAGYILGLCAMWRGDIFLWQKARQHIYEAPCNDENERQALEFWIAVTDSIVNDTREFPEWFKKGIFDCVHADAYPSLRMFYVKGLFIAAHELASGKIELKDVEGLGLMRTMPHIIEPMLSQAKIERTVMPQIYLHLMAATVYHNLGRNEKSVPHIDNAIKLCLPDRLYTVLAEYRIYLDHILDERLMLADEDVYETVKELSKQMRSGWVKLHNTLLERNVSDTLTTRERHVAKLAAFGYSNAEIAKQIHIEVSSVKRYIFSAMNKVGANKRLELGKYI